MTRAPQTLHEHYQVEPLGCSNYPAYCRLVERLKSLELWDEERKRIGALPELIRLLDSSGNARIFDSNGVFVAGVGASRPWSVAACINWAMRHAKPGERVEIHLRGGLMVREWTAGA